MHHYTNKAGWNAIRSAPVWLFRAADPPPEEQPSGAYFTTLPPSTPKLARRLGIPAAKVAWVFEFEDAGDLLPLRGPRGRFILYSPIDHPVAPERQRYDGPSGGAR
jgi:hypothetical protein